MAFQVLKPGWKMGKFGDIAQNVAVRGQLPQPEEIAALLEGIEE